ncbi:MAG: hypothetical protein LBH61_03625, partial [Dysgonamonadaceae bacterium]|nr:hypothetical protein [Dysgonamonadaceae bacterium]
MKIQLIDLTRMRNETHYQFFVNYIDLLAIHQEITSVGGALVQELINLHDKERLLIDNVRGSDYTEEIAAAD